ncbi:MAG: hypothetical protein A2Y57_01850, partial [Candidatus Woykebacteria bacterium RBG_13_40_7b]
MPERNENTKPQDPRKKHRFSASTAVWASGAIGSIFGGAGYGAARLISNENIANRVGPGIGLGLGSSVAGVLLGIVSQQEAKMHAIRGEVGKSILKNIRGGAETAFGMGASGAIAGYEASGVTGAIVGSIIGVIIGAGGPAQVGKATRELGIAYRNLIIPTKEPSSFPQFGITRVSGFNEEEVDLLTPRVYNAPTIGAMKGFRQAQV